MGRRGPKPTPTHVLLARGSRRARERPPGPNPDPAMPEPPAWLTGTAREAWDDIAPRLHERGVLSRIDGMALARYCVMFARWREAEAFVARHGTTYPVKDAEGKLKMVRKNPYVEIGAEASRQLGRLEGEFGMTPAARPRVPSSPPLPAGRDAFLNPGRWAHG